MKNKVIRFVALTDNEAKQKADAYALRNKLSVQSVRTYPLTRDYGDEIIGYEIRIYYKPLAGHESQIKRIHEHGQR